MSGALEFPDPKVAFAAQKAIYDTLIHEINEWVERPLRRLSYPEMPADVAGRVRDGVNGAVATMSNARVAIAAVAQELKRTTYDLVEHDSTDIHWGWKLGSGVIEFTSLDAGYKTYRHARYGEYSKGEVAASWAWFGANFIPVTKIPKLARYTGGLLKSGGKGLVKHGGRAGGWAVAQGKVALAAVGKVAKGAFQRGEKLYELATKTAKESWWRAKNLWNDVPVVGKRVPAKGTAPWIAREIERRSVSSPRDGAIFWSGGGRWRSGDMADQHFGRLHGAGRSATTLERTEAGKWLEGQDLTHLDPKESYLIWRQLSERYAREASGEVTVVFHLGHPPGSKSIWTTTEFPALRANPDVTRVFALIGDKRVQMWPNPGPPRPGGVR